VSLVTTVLIAEIYLNLKESRQSLAALFNLNLSHPTNRQYLQSAL
jgi:hypothetical protein